MTREEQPWNSAGLRVAKQAPDWFAWAERRWGVRDPWDRAFWSRAQFRAALREMPRKHPDRPAYEVGAKYATRGDDWKMGVAIMSTVIVLVASIPLSIVSGLFIWAVSFPFVATLWASYLLRKRKALSG